MMSRDMAIAWWMSTEGECRTALCRSFTEDAVYTHPSREIKGSHVGRQSLAARPMRKEPRQTSQGSVVLEHLEHMNG